MNVDDRAASIQFLKHRREERIAEPLVSVAREQPDAIGLERIEGILELTKASILIGQRQYGKRSEAMRRRSLTDVCDSRFGEGTIAPAPTAAMVPRNWRRV
jgi:hypothetical protein